MVGDSSGASGQRPGDRLEAEALALFEQSLEQPEGERHEWLARRCAGAPELLEQVLRLVEAERHSGGFLEDGPRVDPADLELIDRAGDRLGAFELIEILAVGGMSTVYRARRADGAYDQEVAVKLFELASLDAAGRRRFEAERRIVAALEHPGIARIIDGGTAADGTPYVVMELVRGEPITRYCRHKRIDVEGRLQLLQQVCEALEVAHRRGIVHRDIKAGNVLVTDEGLPKLIDFGIARILDPAALAVDLPATRQGAQFMTPEYASPEQFRGKPVGIASDVYSLGVLAYEMLTGARPHQLAGKSPADMERTVCGTLPVDPSGMVARRRGAPPAGLGSPRTLRRRLRGDIDRIVMTAMRLEPGQRYTTAPALADDIERHLSGKPVHARGASALYRAGKFISRYRAGVGAATVIFLAMAVALVAIDQQREVARAEAARAEAAKDFLVEMISRADPYENSEAPTIAGAVRQAIPGVGEQFAGQPRLEAEMRHAIGFALSGLGDYDTAYEQLEQALEIYNRVGTDIERAEVLSALAGVSWGQSDYPRADAQYQQAIAGIENDPTPAARQAAFQILIDWAGLLPKMNRGERGVELALRAVEMADALPEVDPLDHAVLYNNLAASYDALEAYDKAIAAYEKSIELHRLHSDTHPDLATALGNLGLTYELVDQMDKAVATVEQAVAMQRELLGPDHPQYVLMLYNLGSLQINAGQLERAAENLKAAVEAAEHAYPGNHLYTGRFNHRIAVLYAELERPELARAHARVAQGIYQARDDVPAAWRTELQQIIDAHDLL